MNPTYCPCGSEQALTQCCGRYHTGLSAPDAEALMRSRYSAYVLGLIDYLVETTLPTQQAQLDRQAMTDWSTQSTWLGLQVERHEPLSSGTHAHVSFTAMWRDIGGEHQQHERSAFVRSQGRWHFIDPTSALKAGRNDPCPCASGIKFKKCCSVLLG